MAISLAEQRRRSFQSRPSIIYLNEEVDLGCIFQFVDYTFSPTASTVSAGDILTNTNQFESFLSNAGFNTAPTNGMVLPLPRQLVDNFSANVAGKEAGIAGAYAGEAIGQGDFVSALRDAYDAAGAFGSNAATFLSGPDAAERNSAFANAAQITGTSAQLLIRAGVGSLSAGLSGGIDAALSSTVNNYQTLTFDGVPLKQHTLNFEFAPETERQSQNLAAAIKQLKFNSLPAYDGMGSGSVLSRALLKYPSLVKIAFWGLDDRYFYKFKPAMISNVSVDYTPQGNALLRGAQGARPAFVNLSITFVEQSIWTQDDAEWDDFDAEVGED